jgi:hypothetical protein
MPEKDKLDIQIFPKTNKAIYQLNNLPPLTLPYMSPITSISPPDLACITILIRATAEIFTLLKWFGLIET